jgi:uncharacterized membrane protein (UPF0127 family)
MKYAYIVYAVFGVVAIGVLIAWFFALSPFIQTADNASGRTIQLDGNVISVSVAGTDAARQLGLGGRTGLAPNEGMLFVFQADGTYAFWMKDMHFSIDIIWISSDDHIVYMAQNISPDTYPHSFVPTSSARYVLELPAGYAAAHGVQLGDTVQL